MLGVVKYIYIFFYKILGKLGSHFVIHVTNAMNVLYEYWVRFTPYSRRYYTILRRVYSLVNGR